MSAKQTTEGQAGRQAAERQTGKQNLDNLMRKVIKVSPEELKRRMAAEKQAKREEVSREAS
ncbi:MAG TPA: hypothetical protein VKR52_13860 [Terracidiphilus sp.]|nr:hypothetical protein [Terracidiphilus sp.]